jgi:hypothetical protein
MCVQIEKTIPVVTNKQPANFPFAVQGQNTENWSTAENAVTLDAAMEAAHALAAKYPKLPVRIEHSQGGPVIVHSLPVFKRREGDERPYRHALWSGAGEPPAVGSRVIVRINGIGPGTVTGYAVEGGYLGVMVQADEATRPDWHKKQNPSNGPAIVFGAELKED